MNNSLRSNETFFVFGIFSRDKYNSIQIWISINFNLLIWWHWRKRTKTQAQWRNVTCKLLHYLSLDTNAHSIQCLRTSFNTFKWLESRSRCRLAARNGVIPADMIIYCYLFANFSHCNVCVCAYVFVPFATQSLSHRRSAVVISQALSGLNGTSSDAKVSFCVRVRAFARSGRM